MPPIQSPAGTSQAERLSEWLAEGRVRVDGLPDEALAAMGPRFAALFRHYDSSNTEAGTLAPFLQGEVETNLARVAAWRMPRAWHRRPTLDPAAAALSATGNANEQVAMAGLVFPLLREAAAWWSTLPATTPMVFRDELSSEIGRRLAPVLKTAEKANPDEPVGAFDDPVWHRRPIGAITPPTELSVATLQDICACMEGLSRSALQTLSTYQRPTADCPPQIALYLAFLKLFDQARGRINRFAERHLDFYYRDVLQQAPSATAPDAAIVSFQPAPNAPPLFLPGRTQLAAGKDARQQDLFYALDSDVTVDQAVLAAAVLCAVRPPETPPAHQIFTGTYRPVTPPPPGPALWAGPGFSTFGGSANVGNILQPAQTGFALASPLLELADGVRKITLTVTLATPPPNTSLPPLSFQASGPNGWFALPNATLAWTTPATLQIQITLDATQPAIVANAPNLGAGLSSGAMLGVLFDQSRGSLADSGLTALLSKIELTVDVTGTRAFSLSTATVPLDPTKPFQPFGFQPEYQDWLALKGVEALRKPLTHLVVHLTWTHLPLPPPPVPPKPLPLVPPKPPPHKPGPATPGGDAPGTSTSLTVVTAAVAAVQTTVTQVEADAEHAAGVAKEVSVQADAVADDARKVASAGAALGGLIPKPLSGILKTGQSAATMIATVAENAGRFADTVSSAADKVGGASGAGGSSGSGGSDGSGFVRTPPHVLDTFGYYYIGYDLYAPSGITPPYTDESFLVTVDYRINGGWKSLQVAVPPPIPTPLPPPSEKPPATSAEKPPPIPTPLPHLPQPPQFQLYQHDKNKLLPETVLTLDAVANGVMNVPAADDPAVPTGTALPPSCVLRISLTGPETGYGAQMTLAASQALAMLKAQALLILARGGTLPDNLKNIPVAINSAYTPLAADLSLDYRASATSTAGSAQGASLFHLSPFGAEELTLGQKQATFMPVWQPGGTLSLAFQNVQPGGAVSCLFVLQDTSTPPTGDPPTIQWQYRNATGWADFPLPVSDHTDSLRQSGRITFAFPLDASGWPGQQPDCLWAQGTVANPEPYAPTLALLTQAASCTRVLNPAGDQNCDVPLPAGTITGLAVPNPAIATVRQPLPSSGGRRPEDANAFRTRMSERLRHKARAVTAWDYERQLLAQFPTVFSARCFPGTTFSAGKLAAQTGAVTLLVVPRVYAPDALSAAGYPPAFVTGQLDLMREGLASVASASAVAELEVANAPCFTLTVTCSAAVTPGTDPRLATQRLNADLRAWISPWIFGTGTSAVTWPQSRYAIRQFIQSRDYIAKVTDYRCAIAGESDTMDSISSPPITGGLVVTAWQHELKLSSARAA